MTMDYVRRTYEVPAKRGGRVRWRDREGTIVRASCYVHVRLDGDRRSRPFHPTSDGLVYLDAPDHSPSAAAT